jgi:hypothetical protein
MLTFKEYLSKLNESEIDILPRDFSFSTWLFENRSNPEIRGKINRMSEKEQLEKSQLIMELVKQKLFTHFPMWRPFWSKLPPIASFGAGDTDPEGFGTMCTTGTAIYYDPKFVLETYEIAKSAFKSEFKDGVPPNAGIAIRSGARHPMDYALFVIIHEILHCSLKHHLRIPNYESEYLTRQHLLYYWNLAADYEINHILLDDVKSSLYVFFPGGVRADEGGFAVPADEQEFFKTKTAEAIFYRLVRNVEEKIAAEQESQEDESDEEGEGEDSQDSGENGEGGSGSDQDSGENGDSGSGGDEQGPLKPGEVIYDRETGEYGVVTNVSGDDIEYDPISEDEARRRLGPSASFIKKPPLDPTDDNFNWLY